MQNSIFSRALLFSAGIAYSSVVGMAACGGGEAPAADSSAAQAGVIDKAPTTTATVVSAMLGDENVFALLDTAYAEMMRIDSIAQKTVSDNAVRELAQRSASQNALGRKAVTNAKAQLGIPEVLPDKKLLNIARKGMDELGSKSGADYDKAYLDVVIATRDEAIDEIDDALKSTRITRDPIKNLLNQVKSNFEADKKAAEELKGKVK